MVTQNHLKCPKSDHLPYRFHPKPPTMSKKWLFTLSISSQTIWNVSKVIIYLIYFHQWENRIWSRVIKIWRKPLGEKVSWFEVKLNTKFAKINQIGWWRQSCTPVSQHIAQYNALFASRRPSIALLAILTFRFRPHISTFEFQKWSLGGGGPPPSVASI